MLQIVITSYSIHYTKLYEFTKTGIGGTDNVWFYDMKADGYSLDDKRQVIEANDIPDIIMRFNNLEGEDGRITSYNVCYTKLLRWKVELQEP